MLAIAVLGVLALAGCGSSSTNVEAQPAPDVTVFRTGDFDQLPRYPRTEDLKQPTRKNDVVTQTFSVSNATPQQVLQFYTDHLDGWHPIEPVQAEGTDSYRGTWVKGDRELLVTSSKAPALSGEDPTVQYSLELGPPRSTP